MSELKEVMNGSNNITETISFKNFVLKNEGISAEKCKNPIFSKTHQDTGEVENVYGMNLYTKKGSTIMMILSRNAAKIDFNTLMSKAESLQVRTNEYTDSLGNIRKQYLLCTGASEGDGNIISLNF